MKSATMEEIVEAVALEGADDWMAGKLPASVLTPVSRRAIRKVVPQVRRRLGELDQVRVPFGTNWAGRGLMSRYGW